MVNITFSNTIVEKYDYCIRDPWKNVSKFFLKNMEKFGYIVIPPNIENKMHKHFAIYAEELLAFGDTAYAVVGNRYNNMQYHISNILKNNFKNIWVDISLMEDFLSSIKDEKYFQEGSVVVNGEKSADKICPTTKSVSITLGLFGKFYGKKLPKEQSSLIGDVQEDLWHDNIVPNKIDNVIKIVDDYYQSHQLNLPSINIFNKTIEGLMYVKQ